MGMLVLLAQSSSLGTSEAVPGLPLLTPSYSSSFLSSMYNLSADELPLDETSWALQQREGGSETPEAGPSTSSSMAATRASVELERHLESLKPCVNGFLIHLNLPPLTDASSTDEIFSALKASHQRNSRGKERTEGWWRWLLFETPLRRFCMYTCIRRLCSATGPPPSPGLLGRLQQEGW